MSGQDLAAMFSELPPYLVDSWGIRPREFRRALVVLLEPFVNISTIWRVIDMDPTIKFQDMALNVNVPAKLILARGMVSPSSKEEGLDLVNITPEEIGFKTGASFAQVCEWAVRLGLQFCPPQVGPILRKDYSGQPLGEFLMIAMEPIVLDGHQCVFGVNHYSGGLYLHAHSINRDHFLKPDQRLVFVYPRE